MTRAPGPSDDTIWIYKTLNWKKTDTILVVVIHKNIRMKEKHHPKVFESLAFGQKIVMN